MKNRRIGANASSQRWIMFVVLTIAYFFVYFHRMSINAVGGDMVSDVGGSKEFLSSIYFWTYAFMQIPSGILADRFGPRKSASLFLGLAAVGSIITAIADSFVMLAIGKVLIAAGMAVVYIPLTKVISIWYPSIEFPRLNGIVIAVGNVGALAAAGPLYALSNAIGWRSTFLVLSLITILLAVACIIFIRDRPIDSIEKENKTNVFDSLKTIAKGGRKFWPLATAYFLIYGSIMVFQGTTSIQYFSKDVYSFSQAAWFVTAIGIGKIGSTLFVGHLVSSGLLKSKKKVMIIGTICFSFTWLIIWLFSGEMNSQWFWCSICTAFGFFGGFMTLSFSQVKEWFSSDVSATAMSSLNFFLFMGGAALTAIAGLILGSSYTIEKYEILWALMTLSSIIATIFVVISIEKKIVPCDDRAH